MTEEDFSSDPHVNSDGKLTEEANIIEVIEDHFKCGKCNGTDCTVKEIAMTGAGLSKLLDIQHNHYLFVSCMNCGSVEIYDPNVLEGHKVGKLGSILDVLFG
ncbi:zinc ribbon domain-containing protein [Paenibacillus glycanilyticus]|uniref:zinc ribbon domain-containing protein n=1 Tax=Paenibacillus glycanilyticus TaxID=126569 RepID=UPI0024E0CE5E|nr:zinc ribbon domain-containing protein [Paenibacillus glycanilyticus]